MPVLRHRLQSGYTILPTASIRDGRLSLKSIGCLTFLLALPPEWNFSFGGLLSVLPHDGERSLRSALNELEEAGFLRRERVRDSKGRLSDTVWTVSDLPMDT